MKRYPVTYNEFKQGLKEGKLIGFRCNSCNDNTLPPNGVCSYCGSLDVEVKSFIKRGYIKTFTVSRVAPEGFQPPYIVAMVELEEGPCIIGNLVGIDLEKADIDLIGNKVAVDYMVLDFEEKEEKKKITFVFTLIK